MSNGSTEFELFCSALRQRSEEPQACAQRFAHGQLDWSKILEGAKRHRVERQVLKGLSNLGPAPEAFVTELRKASQEAAYTSLMQIRETARLAASFRQANIPVMALKGVALSVQTGREPTDRHSRDIDFLIPQNCLALADKTIRGAGYTDRRTRDPREGRKLSSLEQRSEIFPFREPHACRAPLSLGR